MFPLIIDVQSAQHCSISSGYISIFNIQTSSILNVKHIYINIDIEQISIGFIMFHFNIQDPNFTNIESQTYLITSTDLSWLHYE